MSHRPQLPLPADVQALLSELDIVQDETRPARYYLDANRTQLLFIDHFGANKEAPNGWLLVQSEYKNGNMHEDQAPVEGAVEMLKRLLTRMGFPVIQRLRIKRLRALMGE